MLRRLTERCLPLLLAAWLAQPAPACADPVPRGDLRFAAARDEPVWVGEELELHLELWSDGFAFGDQSFVLPEVQGGYLLQGDSTTVKLSEDRDGAAWQGLRYSLLFYPQVAGRLEVPPFDVSFTARAGFGSEPGVYRFRTEPLVVEARLPAGARAGGLLVTTAAFSMDATWSRDLPHQGALQLQTGDALTLEVRRSADDVPGMVFAPLPRLRIEGLGVYPAEPMVEDRVNRGVLRGTRSDAVTFMCESPGRYEIPEWRFQWWDPQREVLAEQVIPALQLRVTANPAYAGASRAPGPERGLRRGLVELMATALLVALAWFVLRPLARWGQRGLRARRAAPRSVRPTGTLQPLNPRGPAAPGRPRSG